MLFKEIEGREIIDKNGERVGFVKDLVFTSRGQVTHIIATPKGIIHKLAKGQLNIQMEDVEAIEDVIMLNKTENQVLGVKEKVAVVPKPPPLKPKKILLKKKFRAKK